MYYCPDCDRIPVLRDSIIRLLYSGKKKILSYPDIIYLRREYHQFREDLDTNQATEILQFCTDIYYQYSNQGYYTLDFKVGMNEITKTTVDFYRELLTETTAKFRNYKKNKEFVATTAEILGYIASLRRDIDTDYLDITYIFSCKEDIRNMVFALKEVFNSTLATIDATNEVIYDDVFPIYGYIDSLTHPAHVYMNYIHQLRLATDSRYFTKHIYTN